MEAPDPAAPVVSRSRTVAVILNPAAGAARARLGPDRLSALLAGHGFEVEMLTSRQPGEAVELAARAAERHPVVVAAGGDGTVHEVATGLLGTGATLGVLPTGSGNDFAFALGISSPQRGALAVAQHTARAIDVAFLDDRPFVNTAGLFLSGTVSHRAAGCWRWAGKLRYVLSSLTALPFYRPQPAVWELAGEPEPRSGRWLLAEISNGPRAGGGFMLAPDADPSDGLLDFCLLRPLGLPTLLRLFPAAARGERLEHPGVCRPRADAARLRTERCLPIHLDGEPQLLDAGEHRISLRPGYLAVLAPPPPAPAGSGAAAVD